MQLAPIVLFVYSRLWHTQQTIEALQKNLLAAESDLIIFSDGCKNEKDKPKVKEVRNYLQKLSGFKSITINDRDKNIGLSDNIMGGVTKVVNEYGKVIVLEDDLVAAPFFLRYMNEALEKYARENSVISIHGYSLPIQNELPDIFFIKGADCWGWATWKRGWDLFEKDPKGLLKELVDQKLTREFDFNGSYPYTRMLKNQIKGKVNSWAIRWYASAFLKNMLTLYPGRSLIFHNGGDGSGTHCGFDSSMDVSLATTPIRFADIPVIENSAARKAMEHFFKMRQAPIGTRIARKIKRALCP